MTIDDVVEIAPRPPAPRRGRTFAIVAVVAVLGAGGAIAAWAATRGDGLGNPGGPSSGPALSCPATVADPYSPTFDLAAQVPAAPSASGVDGRLVPDRVPTSVLVCEYPAAASTGVGVAVVPPTSPSSSTTVGVEIAPPTSGSSTLPPSDTVTPSTIAPVDLGLGRSALLTASDSGAAKIVSTLQGATPLAPNVNSACSLAVPASRYLVGLAYDDGIVWVATPAECGGATNGTTTTDIDVTTSVVAVLDDQSGSTGSSIPPATASAAPIETASSSPSSGGGSDPSEVPPSDPFASCTVVGADPPLPPNGFVGFTATAVRICHDALDPSGSKATIVDRPGSTAVSLADAVNRLPVMAPDTACPAIGGETWRLLFTGAAGQHVSVLVDAGGCRTVAASGRVVQADDALFALLDQVD